MTGTPVGTFASKDVANGIAVSVSGLSLSGAQQVDYSLTERGRELAALLLPLVEWTVVHAEEILGPPDPT